VSCQIRGGGTVSQKQRGSLLSATIVDLSALHAAYMPFIKGGALFIETDRPFNLGDEVFLRLTLMDEDDVWPIAGRVVWLTPRGSQGNRKQGVGLQFIDSDDPARVRVDILLAGALKSDRPTHTL